MTSLSQGPTQPVLSLQVGKAVADQLLMGCSVIGCCPCSSKSSSSSNGSSGWSATVCKNLGNLSMSAAQSSEKFTSKLSYKSSLSCGQLAIDLVRTFSPDSQGKCLYKGDIYDMVAAVMGETAYDALRMDTRLKLYKIHYCQKKLEDVPFEVLNDVTGKSGQPEVSKVELEVLRVVRRLITHDFLILELRRGDDSSAKNVFLQAEKSAAPAPGIYISYLGDVPPRLHDDVQVHPIECDQIMGLSKLIEILKRAEPNYDLRNNNCWHYATGITKSLLLECALKAGAQMKAKLLKKREELEAILGKHNFKNFLKSVETSFKEAIWQIRSIRVLH